VTRPPGDDRAKEIETKGQPDKTGRHSKEAVETKGENPK